MTTYGLFRPLANGRLCVVGLSILVLILTLSMAGCSSEEASEVVVYTSVDQMYSEPILDVFEEQTGIRVKAVYDVEATKTVGLVNRLIAERDRPQADVFWNGEFGYTLVLKEEGILQSYSSPSASDIPSQYVDPEGYWTGFGGRARVLIVNKSLLDPADYPRSLFDLTAVGVPADQIGIAYPVFGTTATHAASLYAALGPDGGRQFHERLSNAGVRVVDGNAVVRDLVVEGQLVMGLTDTDDAYAAVRRGADVDVVFLDQEEGGLGTLIIPNSVAMISGAPNPETAKALIDFLLAAETENMLVDSGWFDLTVRAVASEEDVLDVRSMDVSLDEIFEHMETAKKDMQEIFIR